MPAPAQRRAALPQGALTCELPPLPLMGSLHECPQALGFAQANSKPNPWWYNRDPLLRYGYLSLREGLNGRSNSNAKIRPQHEEVLALLEVCKCLRCWKFARQMAEEIGPMGPGGRRLSGAALSLIAVGCQSVQ